MKRLIPLVSFVLVVAACGGADQAGDGDQAFETITPGVLTVCTDAPYPPMEFEQDGEFTGFDIELMRAIAEELGLSGIEVVNSGFDPITSGAAMEAGQCDIAAASITITEERDENIDFSDPYFTADQSLLVKKDSGISSLADLAGKRIGVQSGTTGEAYANENAPEGAEIVSFDNPGDLFVALEAGDIDAILQDLVVNQARTLEDDTVAVVETYPTDEQYGFAVKEEGAEALLEAVNQALATLRENGTYDRIYQEWFPQG
jgi:polar amino acid transport system substrate-binding protein